MASMTRRGFMCRGNGSWTSIPSIRSSPLSFSTSAIRVASEISAGNVSSKEASPALTSHIDLARRIVPDEDCGEAGGQALLVAEPPRGFGDAAADLGGDRLAVDDLRLRHAALHLRHTSTLLDSGAQATGCRRKKSIVDSHVRIPRCGDAVAGCRRRAVRRCLITRAP